MSIFFASFIDELTKLAKEKEKEGTLEKIVHHPATQAAGYGALAGEGVHALAEGGRLGKRVQRTAHTRAGRALGTGALVGGTVFLAAEGLKALKDALRKKDDTKKEGHKKKAAAQSNDDKKKDKNKDDELRSFMMAVQQLASEKLKDASSLEGRRRAMQRRMLWGS